MAASHKIPVAFVVTPHGFGHAARACALAEALHKNNSRILPVFFTQSPKWFFQQSLKFPFRWIDYASDIGLAQKDAMTIDWIESKRQLKSFESNLKMQSHLLGQLLHQFKVRVVICDIAPMGLLAAKIAGIPSILIENFTWSWIYQGYKAAQPWILHFAKLMRDLEIKADLHIQTQPYPVHADKAYSVLPMSRVKRSTKSAIRKQLGVTNDQKMIVLSMGGFAWEHQNLEYLKKIKKVNFVIMTSSQKMMRDMNLIQLPQQSQFYHPDLIHAADAVIGKAGYSTTAEAINSGVPFGIIVRHGFRESQVLGKYIENHRAGRVITERQFRSGRWGSLVDAILSMKKHKPRENGTKQAANIIYKKLLK